MPWPSLRSRPASRAGHRRHSSLIEDPVKPNNRIASPSTPTIPPPQRLSLGLHRQPTGAFAVLTQEPEALAHEQRDEEDRSQDLVEHEPATQHPAAGKPETDIVAEPPHAESHKEQDRASSHPVRPQRFSLLKFRHASDPQLSSTFRKSDVPAIPALPPPSIVTTSPIPNVSDHTSRQSNRMSLFAREKRPLRSSRSRDRLTAFFEHRPSSAQNLHSTPDPSSSRRESLTRDQVQNPAIESNPDATLSPPAYGDAINSTLAIPMNRSFESSHSEGSSDEPRVYAKTTTTHTVSTTTTFFRLPRRKKDKGPLFPLPPKVTPSSSGPSNSSPRHSTTARLSASPERNVESIPRRSQAERAAASLHYPSPHVSNSALVNPAIAARFPPALRKDSSMSIKSGASTPSLSLAPPKLGTRGRSSTLGSINRSVDGANEPSPVTASGRTSTSTTGRKSFGDIFALTHRLRQNSEPPTRHSPGTPGSKSNSMQMPREAEAELVYPPRAEDDTPATYIEKLEAAISRGAMATVLCKSPDEFSKTCLRKYMRGFSYFGDSLDMAVRKMLMEVILPKETQQIDRLLAGFADRYHECNPGIFVSPDEASIAAFSILLLHSDNHNKNNKRKMQKADYIKNTQGPVSISADILECFYDNVCYTPFIHFEDDVAVHSHRLAKPKKRSLIKPKSSDNLKGPIDPYALILDDKLSILRPSLKDVMDTEDLYKYTGTLSSFNISDLHDAFLKSSILQIVSARSRPDAFSNQATISNPAEAQAGIVSIKVVKIGLLWRKDPKKKKAKRPWQEHGAILTDSKLYFFRDVGWTKKLISQAEAYQKSGKRKGPLVFHPPLTSFEPDALMSMDDTVALVDSSYKKHKNGFVFVKHGGFEEIFLANSEGDMNDWLGKLNYAATFRTAGVRIRGMVETPYDGERYQMKRKGSQLSTLSQESQPQAVTISNRQPNPQMAWEIMFYRRQIINEKLSDYDEKLSHIHKELEYLLRSARHLQTLLPIQAKTREALIFAAGRMSAKLKWTRMELWRTKCHRDVLKADLEIEKVSDFPAPQSGGTSKTVTPQKPTASKPIPQALARTQTDTSSSALSPVATSITHSPVVPGAVEKGAAESTDNAANLSLQESRPMDYLELPVKHSLEQSPSRTDAGTWQGHDLRHQPSIVSSHQSKVGSDPQDNVADVDSEPAPEQQAEPTKDLTLVNSKRPSTAGSDRDRVGAISPEPTPRDRGSVRRSLQRTLRDSPHASHHASLRGKRLRESGSSFVTTDESGHSHGAENGELRRSTGSFMVHGKKASVVTFGSELNEDRLKAHKSAQDGAQRAELNSPKIGVLNGETSPRLPAKATVHVDEDHNEDLAETFPEMDTEHDSRRTSQSTDARPEMTV